MDKLPPEILLHIFDYIPTSTYRAIRLTCQHFNTLISKSTFSVLISFLNPSFAEATLHTLAQDPMRRRSSIWSPNCRVPMALPVTEDFLMALWVGLTGTSWSSSNSISVGNTRLTMRRLQGKLRRRDLTGEVLREALFRYALYLSYIYEGE